MVVKFQDIEILEKTPFANDVLRRQENAIILTEFITSSSDPMIICIDAPWGTGKTTFLKMWQQHLKNNNTPCLYFNAWENEFFDNVLVCLIGEISASIEELSKHGDQLKAKENLAKIKKIGTALIKRVTPVFDKAITTGALTLDSVTGNTLSDLAESIAREEIEQYENSKKNLAVFREVLANFTKSITSENNPKPLVFIIDEIDRCRPSFAIEILEKAKHFFNVKNIVFVLGADKQQLGASIKTVYDSNLNANNYLRRFIDLDYVLPLPDDGNIIIDALFKRFSISEYCSQYKISVEERADASKNFKELCNVYKLTFREQWYCCFLFYIAIRSGSPLYPHFFCFLIVLKVTKPEVYNELLSSSNKTEFLYNYLINNKKLSDYCKTHNGKILEAFIVTGEVVTLASVNDKESILYRYKLLLRDPANREHAQEMEEMLEMYFLRPPYNNLNKLNHLLKKLEVASRFSAE